MKIDLEPETTPNQEAKANEKFKVEEYAIVNLRRSYRGKIFLGKILKKLPYVDGISNGYEILRIDTKEKILCFENEVTPLSADEFAEFIMVMANDEPIDASLIHDTTNYTFTNQEAKADNGKPKITLVPRQIIWDIAEVREYGNKKYHDPDNWKNVEPERFRDALCRHFLKYLDDPKSLDEESGIKHLKHMACNIAFLCEMEDKDE